MALSKQEQLVNRKIGKTIAKKRRIAGYTQEQVAEHLGIGNEAFSRIERGLVSPGIFKLYEMAELFECGVETFLIEGSRRPTDQAEHVQQLLSRLSPVDRQMLVGIIEKLALRIGRETRKSKYTHVEAEGDELT
ncbi:helix-turn-helix domain-containing protein [Pandoraea commovens]|uniref:HTH-type transcriptional regulator ImmR n=1 Tax=Pandoraea commovens TaxID=2508289 RepID=A0A5E4YIB7_9BURK|nr:helix-turn-helix transcriptional regulator [Pandoraea commovens]VVE48546.1 HTH-type transcriptional regulator ImmR [Pandoraea commovens]